jgi:hypothetical protein
MRHRLDRLVTVDPGVNGGSERAWMLRQSSAWWPSTWQERLLLSLAVATASLRAVCWGCCARRVHLYGIRGSARLRNLNWLHCTSPDCDRRTLLKVWDEVRAPCGIAYADSDLYLYDLEALLRR